MSEKKKASGLGPVLLTVLLDLLGFGLVIPLIPYYAESYGATEEMAIVIMGMYSLAQFFFAPLWGALSDRIGRRPVMLISITGTVVFLVAFALAPSLFWLFIFRFLHGAFAANISTAQAYVADITTPENRAKGMGLIGASFGVGFSLGPWIGGELGHYALSAPIWLAAALSAVNLVWAYFGLPESRPVGDKGSAKRVVDPRQILSLLRHPVIGVALLLTFTATLSFSMMEYSFGLVAEHTWFMGLTKEQVMPKIGRIFGLIGLIGIIIQGGLIGRLVKRFGERSLIIFGYSCNAVGLAGLAWVSGGWETYLVCTLIAVGSSTANPSLQALISRGVTADEQGSVMGVNQSLSAFARASAPWIAMSLYAWPLLGSETVETFGLPVDSSGVFHGFSFMVAGLLMFGAGLLAITGTKRASASS